MDNNFLLTYDCTEQRSQENFITSNYAWFEAEEELREFVEKMTKEDSCFSVNEAIEIIDCRQIEI